MTEAELFRERAEYVAAEAIDEIVRDQQPTTAYDRRPSERVYMAVAGELRALIYQVAEMAEFEDHQLVRAAEYLHGLLEREPLRSAPAWAPQRVVLGLFLLGLTNALASVEAITGDERDVLRPAYYRDAAAALAATIDPVYVPPADTEEPTESMRPEMTDEDALALL